MEVESREVSFDAKLRHVKRGERRVAEMECQVHCLREKLSRLEKMLPRNDALERPQVEEDTGDKISDQKEMQDAASVCPIDEIAKKEKFLRKQIYDMECTEKSYIRQIADLKIDSTNEEKKNNVDTKCTSPRKNRKEIAKERLSLLESYSQKLCSNLQNLQKNHAGLTQEAQNLSQVLEETRKNCSDKREVNKNSSPCEKKETKKLISCSCKKLAKCDSCIVCSCDEWEHDLENSSDENKQKQHTNEQKAPVAKKKCTCYTEETSSSSESEGTCECQHVQQKTIDKVNHCHYNNLDVESVSSNDSSDGHTLYSEKSNCTCYCSKNQSHEELLSDSDCHVCNGAASVTNSRTERFRGGLDTINVKATTLSVERKQKLPSNFPALQNAIVDNLKLVKVDELRSGLERLKIRNRNLKDFLQTLENPLALANKPSEIFSTCTEVSSCYTLDLVGQTHSGLLGAVKVLEDKCRSKDAIIVALADELKTGGSRKFRARGKELGNDRAKIWKSLVKEKKLGRRFTKKDSAIGFLVFLMILISHVKRSEMISYLSAVRKILTESPFRLISFINESEKLSANYLSAFNIKLASLTKSFMKRTANRSKEIRSLLNESLKSSAVQMQWFHAQIREHMHFAMVFLIANKLYVVSISSIICAILLIIKYRKFLANHLKTPDDLGHNKLSILCKPIKTISAMFLRLFQERVLSSRIFWLILGFCSHVLWTLVQPDVFELMDSYYTIESTREANQENLPLTEVAEETVFQLFHELVDYSWLMSMCSKFQTLVEFSCYVLQNVLCVKNL